MGKLTAVLVRNLKEPGRYSDGQGLMLVVAKDGSRKWVLRVQADGRRRDFGLGAAAQVSLAEAREAAAPARRQAQGGRAPAGGSGRARIPERSGAGRGKPSRRSGRRRFKCMRSTSRPGRTPSMPP